MSFLWGEPLQVSLTQRMRSLYPQEMRGIRPQLIGFNDPTGTVYLEVRRHSDGFLIGNSDTVDLADVATLNYWHGYVAFDFEFGMQEDVEYRVTILPGTYVYSASSYVAWAKDYGFQKYDTSYGAGGPGAAAFDMEMWIRKLITKGSYP